KEWSDGFPEPATEVIPMRKTLLCLTLASPLAFLLGWGALRTAVMGEEPKPPDRPTTKTEAKDASGVPDRTSKTWTTAVEPKPLGTNVKKGLDWLVEHQLPGGGWGQG